MTHVDHLLVSYILLKPSGTATVSYSLTTEWTTAHTRSSQSLQYMQGKPQEQSNQRCQLLIKSQHGCVLALTQGAAHNSANQNPRREAMEAVSKTACIPLPFLSPPTSSCRSDTRSREKVLAQRLRMLPVPRHDKLAVGWCWAWGDLAIMDSSSVKLKPLLLETYANAGHRGGT